MSDNSQTTIIPIADQQTWTEFFNQNNSSSFLQSWEWGEVQKTIGYPVLRLAISRKNHLIAIAQVIKIRAKRGNFLFIPHGPIVKASQNKNLSLRVLKLLLNRLIDLAKEQGFSFIRIAPIIEEREEEGKFFHHLGFRTAPIYLHGERIWRLSLNQTEDFLLKKMRKTTRYLIRKGEKQGIIVEKRTDDKAVDDFWKIYQLTAKREKFNPFSKNFIRAEFEEFRKTNNSLFLFSRPPQSSTYLSAALIIFTQSSAFYHQGASIHSKIPTSYLLQWQAIKEAKKRGCRYYNFWGIYKKNRTPKSWKGLTLFKKGFGGEQIDYLPTQDYVISPRYYLTKFYEKYLRWRRGVG